MLTEADITEVMDILESEYYSLGITSGHEALANLISDFLDGHLDETFAEWGVSKHQFHAEIFWFLAKRMIDEKKMWQSYQHYHKIDQRRRRVR